MRFNDGNPIPEEVIGQTLAELQERFGAVSSETQTIRGLWEHGGRAYRDELVRIFVDVPDTPESRDFFPAFKERMKLRFQQFGIWITTYRIDVI